MKAALYRRYGPPEAVVQIEDVEKPVFIRVFLWLEFWFALRTCRTGRLFSVSAMRASDC